jgi:hypothetical protein
MSNDYWRGYAEGREFGYTQGFSMGFWSAVLLIGAVVCAGLLMMRVM